MTLRKPRPKNVMLLAALACATVATSFQSPTLPDLAIREVNNVGVPAPDARMSATLINNTGVNAGSVQMVWYRGSVLTGNAVEFSRHTVPAGPWAAYMTFPEPTAVKDGDVISVCVDPGRQVTESNENNNCEVRVVSNAWQDIELHTPDITMAPVGARVGDPVHITATIRNPGATTVKGLARLFQGHPQSAAAKLLGQTPVSIAANGKGVASWTVIRPAGDSNLFVSIDEVYPREITRSNNIAGRNVYLKAIVDTGRLYSGWHRAATYPVIGDLLGTGQPVMVFAETTGSYPVPTSRVTALQVFTDGTTKELWSRQLVNGVTNTLSPSMADLDGDGQPEIVVEVAQNLTSAAGAQNGAIHVFALDKAGDTKWTKQWPTVGRVPCHTDTTSVPPVLGDMNKDGVADVVVIEKELVILDGRNGQELVRNPNLPVGPNWCSQVGSAAIADVDGDKSNEFIVANFGVHVFNSNGTLKWQGELNNIHSFALVDVEKDGTPELVLPVHRQRFDIVDAKTGALKKRNVPSPWTPFDRTIAVTTSVDAGGLPTIAIANNDYTNGTGVLNNQLAVQWWKPTPVAAAANGAAVDNPQHVVLADLLGQGRPQLISRSDRRSIGIQDIKDGTFLEYFSIFGYGTLHHWPIPVDVDGDGRGEVIVSYSINASDITKLPYEAQFPPAQFLIFGSDSWKKIPATWNQFNFVPNQVDKRLAFRHDYEPWKTHNTWMQQPLRKPCDVDYDEDIDQNDLSLIFSARGQSVAEGDPRDIDRDRLITVADSRICSTTCTSANCTVTNQPARILSVSPRRMFPGTTVKVTIRAEYANFRAGQTTVTSGAGVTVGAVQVIDAETVTAMLTVASGQTGERPVTVTTGTVSATRADGLSLSAGNLGPQVNAGPDQTVIVPGSISLSGQATDDNLPNGKLSLTWQVVGGPGTVTFSNPNGLATTATFSQHGFYVLRLTATDGQYIGSDDLGVTVIQGNQAPYVSAGQDITTRMDEPTTLSGDMHDDGLPQSASPTVSWTKVSGPGSVTFAAASNTTSKATFSTPGAYVLRLTATDGQLSASDEVSVTVLPPMPRLLTVGPDSATPGQTRTVTLTGKFTNFASGATVADFGAGITASPVTVTNATSATVQVTVQSGAALGRRTVTVKTGTEVASKADAFTVGTVGVPFAVSLNLSDRAIAPGGSITANPQVVDAGGNVIANPGQTFTMTVTPQPGKTTGSAPVLNGLSVTFPKLAKRLLNHDVDKDPTGEFTDGDPTDPNHGKETGGVYNLTVTLGGTSVKGTQEVAVLPSGTAQLTLRTQEFGDRLDDAFAAARQALTGGDPAAVAAARAQLTTVLGTTEYSVKLLSWNNVLTPPNGRPLTYAQAAGRFSASADDAAFGQKLAALTNHVRLLRQRIDALQPTAINQADIDSLRAAANTYKQLSEQLAALNPGVLGVVQHGTALNELLRGELPRLFEAMGNKSVAVLGSAAGLTQNKSAIASAPGDIGWSVFSNLLSIFTDIKGYAKSNIIELAISLANSLVNIAMANAVNALAPGDLAIDFVAAGGQFSFVCPNWMNTYVEGSGFSQNTSDNSVAVIGCINSYVLRNLLTLKQPKDLAAALRLHFKIKALAEAAGKSQSIASLESPDEMREGLFGGSQMLFRMGWDKVVQGRLPCVGIVIAFNLESGSFQAVNANMLPACGE